MDAHRGASLRETRMKDRHDLNSPPLESGSCPVTGGDPLKLFRGDQILDPVIGAFDDGIGDVQNLLGT
ncbi:hypothetical protein RQ832_25335, partial [Roseomonas sp. DSM 102946]|nr:hypothetical protein [Roseomonas sp. DSM 102946]